jgi:hypothetical protein
MIGIMVEFKVETGNAAVSSTANGGTLQHLIHLKVSWRIPLLIDTNRSIGQPNHSLRAEFLSLLVLRHMRHEH